VITQQTTLYNADAKYKCFGETYTINLDRGHLLRTGNSGSNGSNVQWRQLILLCNDRALSEIVQSYIQRAGNTHAGFRLVLGTNDAGPIQNKKLSHSFINSDAKPAML
jgi:hypothetical protein